MYFLGLDIGTSSVKAAVVNGSTGKTEVSAFYPEIEAPIISEQVGWAEQNPEDWWNYTKEAIKKVLLRFDQPISAIGISYQMHGLVMLDKNGKVLRPSIIWCDSRAVPFGEKAFQEIGQEKALSTLLNSPGNFTAAKLAWVKDNEPRVFEACHQIMLPGDYIAYKLSGDITVTSSGLSEGIFWDFQQNTVSEEVLRVFGFQRSLIPEIKPVFAEHGKVSTAIASEIGLSPGIPISYKAGDQPNNALSLNVLEPGEIAATAGTSGVIYAVSDQVNYDAKSRINSFAHVNHSAAIRIGILLCINGTGRLNGWLKQNIGSHLDYQKMNDLAQTVNIGSDNLWMYPFGNGAERIFENKILGAHIKDIDLNRHTTAHLFRAGQEGIAFALKYGMEIMAENGVEASVIRAGKANMFLSSVFSEALVNTTGLEVELFDTDGAKGAALGAGYGAGFYASLKEALSGLEKVAVLSPEKEKQEAYENAYADWLTGLQELL